MRVIFISYEHTYTAEVILQREQSFHCYSIYELYEVIQQSNGYNKNDKQQGS